MNIFNINNIIKIKIRYYCVFKNTIRPIKKHILDTDKYVATNSDC